MTHLVLKNELTLETLISGRVIFAYINPAFLYGKLNVLTRKTAIWARVTAVSGQ